MTLPYVSGIKKFISDHDQTPLVFDINPMIDRKDVVDNGSLTDLVNKILEELTWRGSVNQEGKLETPRGRRRSSFDIWRHVKTFRPKTTLYAVMRVLYKLCMDGTLTTCNCRQIYRRVFRLKVQNPTGGLYHAEEKDEYGIEFKYWKEVGLYKTRI